jgi:hypothetical protein
MNFKDNQVVMLVVAFLVGFFFHKILKLCRNVEGMTESGSKSTDSKSTDSKSTGSKSTGSKSTDSKSMPAKATKQDLDDKLWEEWDEFDGLPPPSVAGNYSIKNEAIPYVTYNDEVIKNNRCWEARTAGGTNEPIANDFTLAEKAECIDKMRGFCDNQPTVQAEYPCKDYKGLKYPRPPTV